MTTDPLTGLGDLAALARRLPPGAPAVTAIWIDVDGLLWFNDSEGFEAGDAALAAIGRMLAAECAASGLDGFRVAGDEAVLTRAALTVDEAETIADRVVARSAALGLRFTGPRYAANDRELLTVSALVFRADASLVTDRAGVLSELAHAIYDAGQVAGVKYQRRGPPLVAPPASGAAP